MTDLLAFVRALRTAGVPVGLARVILAAEALAAMPADPYWALRLTLCVRASDLPVFDALWRARSAAGVDAVDVLVAPAGPGTDAAEGADPGIDDRSAPTTGASSRDELTRRDIATLTEDELAEIRRLIAALAPATRPRRPAALRAPAHHGRADAQRTIRLMLRGGGEPSGIRYNRRTWRPRRLLLLIDISGSMSPYADAMLRFAHAAVAAGPTTTEVFALGTRCTRLTAELRRRDANAAMAAMGDVETGWHRGTTLGPAMRTFLRTWSGRTAVRSAIVVIGSDGGESGDMRVLPRQVARLSRIGHTVIWVNPAAGQPGYAPLNPALKESLRHVTHRLPGHSYDSLRRLAELIAR